MQSRENGSVVFVSPESGDAAVANLLDQRMTEPNGLCIATHRILEQTLLNQAVDTRLRILELTLQGSE